MRSKHRFFYFLVSCCLFLASIIFPLHAKIIDRVAAVVNNDVITEYDVDRSIAPRLSEIRRSANPDLATKAARSQILNELINQKLLKQAIDKADIEVTDDDLSRAIANVLQKNRINIEVLRAELAGKNVSFEAYKEQLKEQIRQAKFIQQNVASSVQVSDQDVTNYKTINKKGSNQSVVVHIAWIFFPLDTTPTSKEVRALVRKGRKMADEARHGGDFSKLSKENGGGDQGTKNLSELSAPLANVIGKMEVGAISDSVVTPQGVYVVQLLEKYKTEGANPA